MNQPAGSNDRQTAAPLSGHASLGMETARRLPLPWAEYWSGFRSAITTGLTIAPICILFGVLAVQANWSTTEVLFFSILGFTGSGQFALLPLAAQGAGFTTMFLLAASINSRYIPIAFLTARRLPQAPGKRLFLAHILGDEAYALEQETDSHARLAAIRLTIYGVWVSATSAGALIASSIPKSFFSQNLNLGFPASVVLLYLSFSQLKIRLPRLQTGWFRGLVEIMLCIVFAVTLLALVGPTWFWLPSIAFSSWRLWSAGT